MKTKFLFTTLLLLFVSFPPFNRLYATQQGNEKQLAYWLKEYIPAKYPGVKIVDHVDWFQAAIPELNLTVNWAFLPQKKLALKEVAGLYEKKPLFIFKKDEGSWGDIPDMEYAKGVGYYIPAYASSSMGDLEVSKLSVVQFDGDAREFVETMTSVWAKGPEPREKYRVMMTSDFPPIGVVKSGDVPDNQKSDPDDMQSMVRFLLHANEFDVEGLIASAGTFAMTAEKKNILGVIDRYEKVYCNLTTYDPNYPTADYLRTVTYEGRGNNNGVAVKFGCGKQAYTDIIGKGMDSEASNAIIAAADKPDLRPLWIGVWGGPREVAQAIWDVRNTRSKKELKVFVGKLRIFLIYCQDATHEWLMDEFPDLFIIESKKTYQGMFGGNDPLSDLAWVDENIRNNHGALCDVYPHEGMGCIGVCEGDSPAFLHLLSANRGINNPEDPTQPGWGGQYVRKGTTNHYVDGPGVSSISKWREDYQKEFQERADWCVQPNNSNGSSNTTPAFMQWLYAYIPNKYTKAKMTDHTNWLQAHIGDDLVVNWAQITEKEADLKYLEGHNLTQGKNIFIEKNVKLDWVDHPAVTYFDGAGYYIAGYDSATMSDWEIEKCNVIQFDGDGLKFVTQMTEAWNEAQ